MIRTLAFRLLAIAPLFAGTQAIAQTCPAGNPRVAPDSRYTRAEPVSGQRVVTDTATGLVWKECAEGQTGPGCGGGTTSIMDWKSALATARNSTWAGYNDWRLPNVNELLSLAETGCYSPGINTNYFPNTGNSLYWSSTGFSLADAYQSAGGSVVPIPKGAQVPVRLVRGGQWLDSFDAVLLFADGFEGN